MQVLQTHLNYLDDFRLDTSSDTVDVLVEGVRACNFILRDMESVHLWEFAIKHKRLDYFNGIRSYPLASNYRDMIGLYEMLNFLDPFRRVKPITFHRLMNRGTTRNLIAHEYIDRKRRLLVNFANTKSRSSTLVGNSSYDGDGTWVGTGTAANVATDSLVYVENNGSVRFDKTGAGDAILTLSDLSAKDMSAYGTDWGLFFKLLLPTLTNAMTFTLKIGSSASAYYQWSISNQFDGLSIQEGINQFGVRKQNATVTGTPDDSALDYAELTVTSADTIKAIRLSEMTIKSPDPMDFEYYSNDFVYVVATASFSDSFTDDAPDDDYGTWGDQFDFISNLLNTGAAGLLLKQMQEDTRAKFYWQMYRGDNPMKPGGLLLDAMNRLPARVKKIDPPSLMLGGGRSEGDYYAD